MIAAEKNRNKRRDKKAQKKTRGMRVDDSARKLALIKRNVLKQLEESGGKFDKLDPYNGRSRVD